MTTITLDIRPIAPPVSRQVQASVKTVGDGGNALLLPGAEIQWTANGRDVFRVIFQDLDKPPPDNWIYPFTGTNDGPFGTDGAPSLEVRRGIPTKFLSADAPKNIKYWVFSTSDTDALRLDPMIIIRPQFMARDGTTLGVTCAVLGAAVGALVAWALM